MTTNLTGKKTDKLRRQSVTTFKYVSSTPAKFRNKICPVNVEQEKEKFLNLGQLPAFLLKTPKLKKILSDAAYISDSLLPEAEAILTKVIAEFGDSESFFDYALGNPISCSTASEILTDYLRDNQIYGQIKIYWVSELISCARMVSHGPPKSANKPEKRQYSLLLKSTPDNPYLREQGILCLADHEIGTHFIRMLNEGVQPWFVDRRKFELQKISSRDGLASEEGLATLNTLLQAKSKYLWQSALAYYVACKAQKMSFGELFEHLKLYISSPEQRWKYCMRVKRVNTSKNGCGGYGRDQCYFEGAVKLLRNLDRLDLRVLHSGVVSIDDVSRIRRIARLDSIRIPSFLRDIDYYKHQLRQIALVNNLLPSVNVN